MLKIEKMKIIRSRIPISILFGLSPLIISIAIHLNLSGLPDPSPFVSLAECLAAGIGSSVVSSVLVYILLTRSRMKTFSILFIIFLCFLFALTTFFGIYFHRVFYSMYFQFIVIFFVVFLQKVDFFTGNTSRRIFISRLYIFALVCFIAFTIWTILASYAIVQRTDPRWAEATWYNIYNFILAIVMFFITIGLRNKGLKIVVVSDDSISIDGMDISRLMPPIVLRALNFFLTAPEKTANCRLLSVALELHDDKICRQCHENDFVPSSCKVYRNLYNNVVLKLKTQLNVFDVGTVIGPENKQHIKTKGWRLRFFDDVKLVRSAGRNKG